MLMMMMMELREFLRKGSVVTQGTQYYDYVAVLELKCYHYMGLVPDKLSSRSLRTPHDVVVAVPVGGFVLLHSTVLVGLQAGKVPADGSLPLARMVQAGIVRSGPGGRTVRRHRGVGLGRRQRRHLTEQISQIVHLRRVGSVKRLDRFISY